MLSLHEIMQVLFDSDYDIRYSDIGKDSDGNKIILTYDASEMILKLIGDRMIRKAEWKESEKLSKRQRSERQALTDSFRFLGK